MANLQWIRKVLVVSVAVVLILDPSQSQEQQGGIRFPNIFNLNPFSLPNIFRQQRPQRPNNNFLRNPAPSSAGPAPFLQAPPPSLPPTQQQFLPAPAPAFDPVFNVPPTFQPEFQQGFQQTNIVHPVTQQPFHLETGFAPTAVAQQHQFPVPHGPQVTATGAHFPNANIAQQQGFDPLIPSGAVVGQTNINSNSITPLQPAHFALSSAVSKPGSVSQTSSQEQKSLKTEINLDCGASNDLGFCSVSETYPREIMDVVVHRCQDRLRSMYSEVPEDYDALGEKHNNDNSSGQKDHKQRPWSWSAYEKEPACDSELRYIQPGIARDLSGQWRIIVQSPDFPQRIAIDVCRDPDQVCKVFTDCGRKSRCVQRYSYHTLIAVEQDKIHECPTVKTFRFPTSCVCHVEVDKNTISRSDNVNPQKKNPTLG